MLIDFRFNISRDGRRVYLAAHEKVYYRRLEMPFLPDTNSCVEFQPPDEYAYRVDFLFLVPMKGAAAIFYPHTGITSIFCDPVYPAYTYHAGQDDEKFEEFLKVHKIFLPSDETRLPTKDSW